MRGCLLLALILTSCSSYHWHQPSQVRAIHVPFVQHDMDGQLTAALVEALAHSGVIMDKDSPLVLEVDLAGQHMNSVGYTYGYDDQGNPTTALYPSEARYHWMCKVALKDTQADIYLAPMQKLDVSVDFDYQTDDMPYNEVQFSVGQLNLREEASASSQVLLCKKMARAITDWLVMHQQILPSKINN